MSTYRVLSKPAVTRTVEVSPATVVVTLTVAEAALIAALLGRTTSPLGAEIYEGLRHVPNLKMVTLTDQAAIRIDPADFS